MRYREGKRRLRGIDYRLRVCRMDLLHEHELRADQLRPGSTPWRTARELKLPSAFASAEHIGNTIVVLSAHVIESAAAGIRTQGSRSAASACTVAKVRSLDQFTLELVSMNKLETQRYIRRLVDLKVRPGEAQLRAAQAENALLRAKLKAAQPHDAYAVESTRQRALAALGIADR